MSLQLAAQHMASRGRGPDTTLVHMAPQEVAGLQALAKAHGGSLTINPETGLPEAGFLSNLLPTLIGAGLSIASGGTLTPLMAAGITGAGYGVASGSLKKGLMAGLGAYGGAGLAGSVMGAGTGAISAGTGAEVAAAANNIGGIAPGVEAVNVAQNSANLLGNTATSPLSGLSSGYEIGVPTQASNFSQPLSGLSSGYEVGVPTQAANMVPVTTQMPAIQPAPMSDPSIVSEATQERLLADRLAKATPMDTAKSGLGAIMDKPELLFNKGNMKYGLAAAAPLLFQEQEQKARKEEKPYEYTFDYNRVENPNAGYTGPYTGERTYFNPKFTRTAADGGLMAIGPVEAMSNRNEAETLMANHGQMFADGGVATATEMPTYEYVFDPETGLFKKVVKAAPIVATSNKAVDSGGSSSSTPQGPSEWSSKTPGERAAYYAENPTQAALARGAQTVFGYTTPGALSQFLAPDAWHSSMAEKQGFDPSQTSFGRGAGSLFGFFGAAQEAVPKAGVDVYGYAPEGMNTNYDGSLDRDTLSGYQTGQNGLPSELGGSATPGSNGPLGGGIPSGYESVGGPGTYSGTQSGGDTSQSYGGGDTTSASSADSTASDNSGVGGWAKGGLSALARGGMGHLGDYSDGGRLLRGPGDGVSDSIPASIGDKRPARLADGEFVVPARIVSELGNGSTEAGARKLYAMMDRVQKARGKTVGKGRVAVNSKAEKMLPA